MIYAAFAIAAILLAVLLIGLPYYEAYKRRQELMRREQLERERDGGSRAIKPESEQRKK